MNNFCKYFLIIILGMIGLGIALRIMDFLLHAFFPGVALIGIALLLAAVWHSKSKSKKAHQNRCNW